MENLTVSLHTLKSKGTSKSVPIRNANYEELEAISARPSFLRLTVLRWLCRRARQIVMELRAISGPLCLYLFFSSLARRHLLGNSGKSFFFKSLKNFLEYFTKNAPPFNDEFRFGSHDRSIEGDSEVQNLNSLVNFKVAGTAAIDSKVTIGVLRWSLVIKV